MSKKKILSLALVVCMIAILSFSSLAWFTDVDKATNDFTIGGAGTDDPDDIFSVDVKENVDGEDEPVDEMDFEDVLPGDLHKKEAFIENTGSYDQYIRVVMTITDWKLIKDVTEIKMDAKFNDNWHIYDSGVYVDDNGLLKPYANAKVNADGALVVTMYLDKKLAAGEEVQIMDSVKIIPEATQADFADPAFADGFQIVFDADAAQTENILSTYGDTEWKNAKATFDALA
jgi:predicted ribosomally synthesized peptide with SipW-like signal peptide